MAGRLDTGHAGSPGSAMLLFVHTEWPAFQWKPLALPGFVVQLGTIFRFVSRDRSARSFCLRPLVAVSQHSSRPKSLGRSCLPKNLDW